MVVPHWAVQGSGDEFARLAAEPRSRSPAPRRDPARARRRDGGASIRIARFTPRPDWAGLDLVDHRAQEGTTPLEVVLEIQRHGGAQAISFGMSESDVRDDHAPRFRRHGVRRRDPPARRRRPAPPARLRHVSPQDPLRPRRASPLARAGDPFLLGLARRDPGPARAGHHPRRGLSPTSSSSTPRRSAMRRRSTSRPGTRRACSTSSSTAWP